MLRYLAAALGEQIGPRDLPPLRLDAPDFQHASDQWRSTTRRWAGGRWLIPVVAGAAVLALVVSVAIIGHLRAQVRRGPQQPVTKHKHEKLPRITQVAGTPQFMVSWEDGRRGYVRSVTTGRIVARIPEVATGFHPEGIAAAPGDRIFYLAGVEYDSSARGHLEFFRIVLNSKGRPGAAQQVAGPPVSVPTPITSDGLASVAVAVSPDGKELAFAPSSLLIANPAAHPAAITVRNMVTGASRTWSVWPSTSTDISELSWATGGQLSFVAAIGRAAVSGGSVVFRKGTQVNALMILSTGAAGDSLTRASRLIASASSAEPPAGTPAVNDGPVAGVISGDGRTVFAQVGSANRRESRLVAISVATGRITRVLVAGEPAHQADPAIIDGGNLLFTLSPDHEHPHGLYVCGHLALAKISSGDISTLPFPVYCSTVVPPEPLIVAW